MRFRSVAIRTQLFATALCFAPLAAPAQGATPVTVLRAGVSCPSCRIVASRGPLLGDSDGDGMLVRSPSRAFRDSQGRVYVALTPGPDLPYLFDAKGHFVKRIGRRGHGPGEFNHVTSLQGGAADSVVVFDISQLRRTVLAPGGTVARSTPMPLSSVLSLQMPNGLQLVESPIGSADQIGHPFHVVDGAGRYLRSFGEAREQSVIAGTTAALRLALSNDNKFWAHPSTRYELQQWSMTGAHLRSITRPSSLFNYDKTSNAGSGDRPSPLLQTIQEGTDGLLWVIIRVPSTNWKQWLGKPTVVRGKTLYRNLRIDKLYDSIIEVVDPARNVVIQSQRFAGYFQFFVSDRLAGVYQEDDDGIPRLQLMNLTLVNGPT